MYIYGRQGVISTKLFKLYCLSVLSVFRYCAFQLSNCHWKSPLGHQLGGGGLFSEVNKHYWDIVFKEEVVSE